MSQTHAVGEPAVRAPDPAFGHVVVPLDGSKLAAGAVPTAAALASRFGATVDAISVVSHDIDAELARERAFELLGDDVPDDRVHVVVGDNPAAAIHDRVDELGRSLVCMATHGRGRASGAVVGSVARAVLEQGQAPVVLVGPLLAEPVWEDSVEEPLRVDELVACVDGGPESETVLPVAAAWAHALGMRLTIVTVAEPTPRPIREETVWRRHHGPDGDADAYVAELAERWRGSAPDVRGRVVYDPVSAAGGVRTYVDANPTGLLAVTSHARAGLQRVVFGAGAAEIVHASKVPVLVVPLTPTAT